MSTNSVKRNANELSDFIQESAAPVQQAKVQHLTELIKGLKPVTTKTGSRRVIITTASGKQVWAPAEQVVDGAETVTFSPVKAGQTWTNASTGETGTYQQDGFQFVTTGKQVMATQDKLAYLVSLGAKFSV